MNANQQKISKLHQKLKQIDSLPNKYSPYTSSISQPKIQQTQTFYNMENKYFLIQNRLSQIRTSQEKMLKSLQTQLYNLNQQQKSFKRDLDRGIDRGDQQVHSLQRSIQSQFQQMLQQINTYKRSSVQSIDRKYKTVKIQSVAAINQEFENQCKNSQIQIRDKLQKFKDKFVLSRTLRDQAAQYMISTFGNQIIKLQTEIKQEKEKRILKNSQLITAIKQLDQKIQTQVNKQKKQMLHNKSLIQEMLQDVCYKIEAKVLGK